MEEAVTGLEEEKAALPVEIIGGDSEDPQSLAFSQQLFFPGVHAMVGSSLVGGQQINSEGKHE